MKISEKKEEKICEQILAYLYSSNPKPQFTSYIAREIARDEEFTKRLLLNLSRKGIIIPIKKNSEGIPYSKRIRWKMSKEAYKFYFKKQH
jgi:hypothetical protein